MHDEHPGERALKVFQPLEKDPVDPVILSKNFPTSGSRAEATAPPEASPYLMGSMFSGGANSPSEPMADVFQALETIGWSAISKRALNLLGDQVPPFVKIRVNSVRQAKLGRTNKLKGVCLMK